MLVLSRRKNETIVIDGCVQIEVLQIKGNEIRLGIQAPSAVKILRGELTPFACQTTPLELASDEELDAVRETLMECSIDPQEAGQSEWLAVPQSVKLRINGREVQESVHPAQNVSLRAATRGNKSSANRSRRFEMADVRSAEQVSDADAGQRGGRRAKSTVNRDSRNVSAAAGEIPATVSRVNGTLERLRARSANSLRPLTFELDEPLVAELSEFLPTLDAETGVGKRVV